MNPVYVAIDTSDVHRAAAIARQVCGLAGGVKLGLEFFCANGDEGVLRIAEHRMPIFLDLKLHDIPNTVEKAARVAGAMGARYLTIHAMGGPVMLRAGVDGFLEGAAAAGLPAPVPLAVTVLTSDGDAPAHILPKRVELAIESGAKGLICAGTDLGFVRELVPRFTLVVPGTRPAGVAVNDQARVTTPEEALGAGADILVIGRAVTAAEDPIGAAEALVTSLS
jgi:orotidine-5'-phosphate decarboxylase